jgi:hypothetical protein
MSEERARYGDGNELIAVATLDVLLREAQAEAAGLRAEVEALRAEAQEARAVREALRARLAAVADDLCELATGDELGDGRPTGD